jgi:hypothetical protein
MNKYWLRITGTKAVQIHFLLPKPISIILSVRKGISSVLRPIFLIKHCGWCLKSVEVCIKLNLEWVLFKLDKYMYSEIQNLHFCQYCLITVQCFLCVGKSVQDHIIMEAKKSQCSNQATSWISGTEAQLLARQEFFSSSRPALGPILPLIHGV